MRIDRFQSFALDAYRQAPEIASAEPWQEGTRRPYGIELTVAGRTVRHALTRVPVAGEDMETPEQAPVEGEPPAPVEPRPAPGGVRDRQTAQYLAAVLAGTGHREIARVYAYDEQSQNAGLGVEFHSGAKIHMLLT
ncbi:hypothetical protein [Streptomyces boncukensis]|uniref:Uncharacterized protein n=1 Tax=Streptomyces boncukensis TaxID=2711219 RepID=A0A6G4WW19_9ACTN|nr:hypothetical protein [Streptomyces boncukensis]NGO69308.1 hypothetical protein [Streptomyces boncukensis]